MKRCKVCNTGFTPRNSLETWCSPDCAIVLARQRQAATKRKADNLAKRLNAEKREELKSSRELKADAQRAFNAFIRARDSGKPCVSCGRPDDGSHQRHAGHYRPTGSNPALRFHEDNCHGQCAQCNLYHSGNLTLYREELVRRIGLERVEWLEGPQEPKHYTADDLRAIKKEYRAKARRAAKVKEIGR